MRHFLHRFGLRVAAIAVLALLLAQLGALSHAYSHDMAAAPTSAQQSGASSHEGCNDCLAYAAVLSAAGSPGTLPFLQPPGRSRAARAASRSVADLALTLAFRSRAPPQANRVS